MISALRVAFRRLVKTPGGSLAAILALGLGIGLTTVMYGIVHGVYLRDLPFDEPEELMRVGRTEGSGPTLYSRITHREFLRVREEQGSFERLVGWVPVGANVRGPNGLPRRYGAVYVSTGLFETVGVDLALGRTFRPEEETPGTAPVAIISDGVWRDLFNRSPEAIGGTIQLYGNPVTVVGVAPPGFRFPYRQELWLPLGAWPESTLVEQDRPTFVFGRLAQGVSRREAEAEMRVLLAETPNENRAPVEAGMQVAVWPYVEGHSDPEERESHLWMLGILFAVLWIACANVGGLLLHRVAARERETRIRSALGADRWHTLAPVLAELGVLSTLGGLAGVALAALGLRIYDGVMRENFGPYWAETRLEPSVVAFALGVTLLATLLAAVIPAWRAASHRRGLDFGLRSRSADRGTERWGKVLVVGQITLCCGLLMITGLMVCSLVHVGDQGSKIDAERLWAARFSLYGQEFPDEPSQRRAWGELIRRLESLPEVESVGLVSSLPGSWGTWTTPFVKGEEDTSERQAFTAVANPRAFELLGLDPQLGRVFTEADSRDGEPVIVVSRSFARRIWGQESPLGRHLRLWPGDAERRVRVIGVVPDLPMGPLRDGDEEILYLPLTQMHQEDLHVLLRLQRGSREVPAAIRRAAASVAPNQPLEQLQTLEAWWVDSAWRYRTSGALFTLFGGVALFLACLGLYGVLSFQAQRRLPEWGVRMALGASRGDLFRRVTWSSVRLVVVGLVLGGVLGGWASRYVASLLYRVEPLSLRIFAAMAGVLLLTAFLAGLAPARRAATADPTTLLREE